MCEGQSNCVGQIIKDEVTLGLLALGGKYVGGRSVSGNFMMDFLNQNNTGEVVLSSDEVNRLINQVSTANDSRGYSYVYNKIIESVLNYHNSLYGNRTGNYSYSMSGQTVLGSYDGNDDVDSALGSFTVFF